jgi:hypothetical protein
MTDAKLRAAITEMEAQRAAAPADAEHPLHREALSMTDQPGAVPIQKGRLGRSLPHAVAGAFLQCNCTGR